jgi:hypothetical protein
MARTTWILRDNEGKVLDRTSDPKKSFALHAQSIKTPGSKLERIDWVQQYTTVHYEPLVFNNSSEQ